MIITDILLALAVVGVIGLIAAVLLALVSHFFNVPENETKQNLRAELPGANCGACGYRGCDDYAAALAEGKETKANLCIPGGDSTATRLCQILGVAAQDVEEKVAFVHCNGNCGATSRKADYDGIKTCRAASALYGGPNDCTFGCMGFGDCAAVCPSDAICIKDGIAHVDSTACIGCGLCTSACPKSIISLIPTSAKTVVMCNSKDKGADARKKCSNACIGCKKCEKVCPESAITIRDNLANIDYGKCTGCGLCVEGCPTNCLKSVCFPALAEK